MRNAPPGVVIEGARLQPNLVVPDKAGGGYAMPKPLQNVDMKRTAGVTALIAVIAIGATAGMCGGAYAQLYPLRPIRLVVTAPPGGGADVVARLVARLLPLRLSQQVVVDNRGGANGVIGVVLAARSVPDGYTIVIVSNNFLTIPLLTPDAPYAPLRDFTPVTMATNSPNILVVHPALPVASVQELTALAKSRARKLNYAAGSSGASPHLAAELFKFMAKVDMVHVPYKGAGPALVDLISGQVDLMFATAVSVMPHVKSARLKALAITSAQRSPLAPELETVAASGLPGYETGVTYGFLAPAGTPDRMVATLNAEIVSILYRPEIKERLLNEGSEVVGSSPGQYTAFMKAESIKWAKLFSAANIRLEDR